MGARLKIVSAIARGAVLPALVLAVAASAPLVNNQFVTPIDGRILVVGWWFAVPLGVVVAVIGSGRLWTGAVIGAFSAVAFQLSMVLLAPEAERAAVALSAGTLIGAVAAIAAPWAIGMAFGWTTLHRRPVRHDGVPYDESGAGIGPR
jgi:hypothetical protein